MLTHKTDFRGDRGAAIELELKNVTDAGNFEGYGSIFSNTDGGNDVVMPGAFATSLKSRRPAAVKMLWQHDPYRPIGAWEEMQEDARGLYCKGRLFLNVQQGKEAYELMREGAVDGLSIGYRTKQSEIDRENGVRLLKQVDLLEVSVVTFPMNEAATISLVKAHGKLPTEREFEAHLRDEGFSASQAKGIVAHGYKSLRLARDAGEGDEDSIVRDAILRLAQTIRR